MSMPQAYYAAAEYLALQRTAQECHEYVDRLLYAMAGDSLEHNTIRANWVGILNPQ